MHISASIRARAARNFVQKEPCATAACAAPRTAFWRRGRAAAAGCRHFATAKLLLQRPDGGVVDLEAVWNTVWQTGALFVCKSVGLLY